MGGKSESDMVEIDSRFRKRLDRIINRQFEKCFIKAKIKILLIARAFRRFNYTHSQKAEPTDWSPPYLVTCIAYALGLTKLEKGSSSQTYLFHIYNEVARTKSGEEKIADTEFMDHLVSKGLLKTINTQQEGCLVVYYKKTEDYENKLTHAGIVSKLNPLTVTSRWGNLCTFEHDLLAVPESYGEPAHKYYKPISQEQVETEFFKWLEETTGYRPSPV